MIFSRCFFFFFVVFRLFKLEFVILYFNYFVIVLYTAFVDSSFAKIEFVDYRRWWTATSKLSSLDTAPRGLKFGPNSRTAWIMAFETAGTKYDDRLQKNNCTRSLTLQPTGMIFREFISAENPNEKWTRVTYPNGAQFNVTLISWIPAKSYLKRMLTGGLEWRNKFDDVVKKLDNNNG